MKSTKKKIVKELKNATNMKYFSKFILFIGILISTDSIAQIPDFIKRLDGGTVQFGNFSEQLKFQLLGNRIFINSNVSGKDCKLLVDTYSPCLFYDYVINQISPDTLDRTAQLGKAFEKTFLLPVYPKFDTIKLGSVSFLDIGAMSMKSDNSNPLLKYRIDGILGANLMKKCIWQFDFKDTILTITNKKEGLENIENVIKLPFTTKPVQGSPNTFFIVNNDTVKAEFDTGNDGFINAISPTIKKKIENGDAVPWTIKLAIPINRQDMDSIETHYYVLLDSIQIGNKKYYHIPIIAYNPEIIKQESKGSIGIGFMNNFITTIDWLDNNIYLKEQNDFNLPSNKKTFGFTCEAKNGKLLVKSIFNNSLAVREGLNIDDNIIAVDGIKIKSLTKEALKKLINQISEPELKKDRMLKLRIEKAGKSKEFMLISYNLF
jgi:hypothetical protein